jgi:hypothetical protein
MARSFFAARVAKTLLVESTITCRQDSARKRFQDVDDILAGLDFRKSSHGQSATV